MSDQPNGKPPDNGQDKGPSEAQRSGFTIGYDDKAKKDIMFISVPLGSLTENPLGSCLVRGFLEEVKELALQMMQQKIMAKQTILAPGVRPSDFISKDVLKVIQ